MQAKIKQEGGITVIRLSGRMDLDTVNQFQQACLRQLLNEKVVLNMRALSFVGSNGIMIFLDTLKELGEKNVFGLKACGVGSEFLKIFSAHNLDLIEIYDDERTAVVSFSYPQATIEFLPKKGENLFQSNIQASFKEPEPEPSLKTESEVNDETSGIYPDFLEQIRGGILVD